MVKHHRESGSFPQRRAGSPSQGTGGVGVSFVIQAQGQKKKGAWHQFHILGTKDSPQPSLVFIVILLTILSVLLFIILSILIIVALLLIFSPYLKCPLNLRGHFKT